ncbi:MAG: CdaR family protein [Candidatus Krumholzibacteriales bacterium]
MNIKRLIRIITHNYKAKIISIICAFFLWVHVTAQRVEDQSMSVPLELTGLPDSLTIINDIPESIDVTVKETRANLTRMRLFGDIEAIVDLSRGREGWVNFRLSPEILHFSDGDRPREISIDKPKVLALNFKKVLTKSVPVKLVYSGNMSRDNIIMNTPVIIPRTIKVRGASNVLEDINFLPTEEIDIRNRTGVISEKVKLMTRGYNIEIDPETVHVEMKISERKTRTLANIPPTVLVDNQNLEISCSPAVTSLTLSGPRELVEDIVSSDISIILNISDASPGTYKLKPEIIVPDGIDQYWLANETFTVTVSADSTSGAETSEDNG